MLTVSEWVSVYIDSIDTSNIISNRENGQVRQIILCSRSHVKSDTMVQRFLAFQRLQTMSIQFWAAVSCQAFEFLAFHQFWVHELRSMQGKNCYFPLARLVRISYHGLLILASKISTNCINFFFLFVETHLLPSVKFAWAIMTWCVYLSDSYLPDNKCGSTLLTSFAIKSNNNHNNNDDDDNGSSNNRLLFVLRVTRATS